jgi:hypothetical protein
MLGSRRQERHSRFSSKARRVARNVRTSQPPSWKTGRGGRRRVGRSSAIDGNPIDNIKLIEDPAGNFIVIVKDGKIYKNLLAGKSGE